MAIVRVQNTSNNNTGGVTSVATVYGSNNTAGNLLIGIGVRFNAGDDDDTRTPTFTDTQSNSWQIAATLYGTPSVRKRIWILYAANCAAGANTVTLATSSAVSSMSLGIAEYSGAATASVLDGVSAGASRYSSQIQVDPAALTTAAAGALVIGAVCYDNTATTNGNPLVAGATFTREGDNVTQGNDRVAWEDLIAGAAGSYDPLWDAASTSGIFAALGASFKASGGAAAGFIRNRGMFLLGMGT